MGAFDIAVIVIISVAFAAAVGYTVWRKIKHKGGCDCGCGCGSSCESCPACKAKKEDKK